MRTGCYYNKVLRWLLEESEMGVRWPPAWENVSPEAEECPLLENVMKQCREDHD
jgi:hypothetical protein